MTAANIEVGDRAPAFTLSDQNGDKVRLTDLRGEWVVLYFYPRDDTPGCTTEAKEFTSSLEKLEKLGARVLGCSPDTPESHQKFRNKHRLKVTLLSDPDHRVMEKYGAWGEKNMYGKKKMGVIRSTTLIDPKGKVAHHWKKVKAAGHADKVRDKIEQLQDGE